MLEEKDIIIIKSVINESIKANNVAFKEELRPVIREEVKNEVSIQLKQLQKHQTFEFPLEIGIVKDGITTMETVQVNGASSSFKIKTKTKPDSVILDPNLWLLFAEK